MRTLLITLLIFLVGCNNNKNPGIILSSQEKKIKTSEVSEQIDTCDNVKQLMRIIRLTLTTNKIDFIDTTKFRILLKENNDYTEGCYFPSNDSDYHLLYKFTDTLAYMCSFNENALQLLALLQTHNTTNAEYSEYFMELFPKIAVTNIELFVKGINPLSDKYRRNILYDLGYLPNMEIVNALKIKIKLIRDPQLKNTVDELLEFLDDESNFDF